MNQVRGSGGVLFEQLEKNSWDGAKPSKAEHLKYQSDHPKGDSGQEVHQQML